MIVIIDYILKKYICEIGCALHKKAHVLRAPCALVRLAPFTTMERKNKIEKVKHGYERREEERKEEKIK